MQRAMVVDLGYRDYEECLAIQHTAHSARREGLIPDCLLLVEHPHVLTIGKRGKRDNVRVPEPFLRKQGISCITIERGGDVTYHGPGQLLGYPIFALKGKGKGVIDFVGRLEEVMIRILRDYGIDGERNELNRGVWVGREKVGFVGIAVRRRISFHGFALNVDPELSFFQMINPCGLTGVKVTSIGSLLGREIQFEEARERAVIHFEEIFGLSLEREETDLFLSKMTGSVQESAAFAKGFVVPGK